MKIEVWQFKFLGKPFDVPVHFHPVKGEFVATLPSEIAHQLTGQSYDEKQTGADFNEIRKRIRELINTREIELMQKEVTTKMILYRVDLGGCFDYRVKGRKRTFEGKGWQLGISVSWSVLIRSKLGEREEYRDEGGSRAYPDHRDGKLMEWTEQRQAFFESMDARIQGLVLQFDQFFNKAGRKKLLAAIDHGGIPALPEPSPPSEEEV